MNKLFVFQENVDKDYFAELKEGFERCKKSASGIDLKELSVDHLTKNAVEVVISNGLPKEWYFVLKGLNIVTITLDDIEKYFSLSDVVIDCKSRDDNRYFTGEEYSICRNKDLEFQEITSLIMKLEWDSEFWGFPVAYLSSRYLTDNIAHRTDKIIKRDNIRLVEYQCNCHDSRSVKTAERNGFHFTDIRMTFEKKLKNGYECKMPADITFARAGENDIKRLKDISSYLYKDSRYFFDENFDKEKANEFYKGWVEKAVLGRFDDECWCLYDKDKPFGFCTIKYHISDTANIGLFGMAKDYQGRGLAGLLLNMVFGRLTGNGVKKLSVVTQGRNYAAQRLYQKAGFITKSTELWYHKWLY
jgi:dTDP-4-amino-4,6-dideoxy-D-galactose acyltransferase